MTRHQCRGESRDGRVLCPVCAPRIEAIEWERLRGNDDDLAPNGWGA